MQPSPVTTTLPHIDYRWVFAASLLVSAWLIAMDPLINRDAIIYLRAADAYLAEGFPNGGMTPFDENTLNDERIDDITAYIKSLSPEN